MQLGVWTPFSYCIRPEPASQRALADLTMQGKGGERDRAYTFMRDTVQQAENLGFDLTLVAERLVAPDPEAWVVASALAVETTRIAIMCAVHPGILNPQFTAKLGASIDRLSGGRFMINVVPGNRAHEFALYGNNAWKGWDEDGEDRYARVDEFIRVLKAMWEEENFTFEGRFYTAREATMATKTMQRPRPPVYAASADERGKDIVARECDLWFVEYKPGIDAYEQNRTRIAADIADMRSRAAAHGRKLGFGISTYVACGDDVAALVEDLHSFEGNPQHNVAIKSLGAGLVGTPQTIADRIRRYEDMGISCLMLQFHPMQEGMQTFADRVMPLIGR
ncbi:MAG: LLM class flavin-dependent oxidoreductase [Beijerinckiaceae bacterium]